MQTQSWEGQFFEKYIYTEKCPVRLFKNKKKEAQITNNKNETKFPLLMFWLFYK